MTKWHINPPFGGFFVYYKRVEKFKIMQTIRQYTDSEKEVIKSFFTDVEWDAIDSSLSDYQDYGEEATDLMVSISNKMYDLFNPKYQDENRHPNSGAN